MRTLGKRVECKLTQVQILSSPLIESMLEKEPNNPSALFLEGKMSDRDFLKAIRSLDQSTPTRDHAQKNIAMLVEPGVADKLLGNPEYHNLLSLSYFHVAQQQFFKGGVESVRENLDLALAEAKKVGFKDWEVYVEATIAYADKDAQRLEDLHGELKDGPNKAIVKNMLDGLTNFGDVNYERDYNVG